MGFGAQWIEHKGLISRLPESVLAALDREVNPKRPITLLDVGVENGGTVEVWQRVLPEGSRVLPVDLNAECAGLGVGVLIGDAGDRDWLRGTFGREGFDVIVNDTRTWLPVLWPWLIPGGLLVTVDPPRGVVERLTRFSREPGPLPYEEVLRVGVYERCVVVEKCQPRAHADHELLVGTVAGVLSEEDLYAQGILRLVASNPEGGQA